MNILLVWDSDYPWDIRIDKISGSLLSAGHCVHIACRNLARQPRISSYNSAAIHRLPALPKEFGKLNDAISFPAFFNPLWLWHIYQTTKKNRCDLIIIRDLPMALGASWVAKLLKVPCILDMAECYPEMLRCVWEFEGHLFRNYFLRNPLLADWVEKVVMRRIDQVWVMTPESYQRLVYTGVSESKLRIVSNTPILSRFTNRVKLSSPGHKSYRMIYVGLLNPSRGLDTAIRGAAMYLKENPNFEFAIVGRGKAESQLRQLVTDLGVEENVKFIGWVDNSRVPKLIADANIGIVPHHLCSHWNNTIPNKLFDYMAAAKPVIVSNVIPMVRIVEETGCGLVYEDYDVNGLCSIISQLSDNELQRQQGDNGKLAVEKTYNWEKEEQVLLSAVASFF